MGGERMTSTGGGAHASAEREYVPTTASQRATPITNSRGGAAR